VRALSLPFVMVRRFKARIRTAYGGKYRNNFMARQRGSLRAGSFLLDSSIF
jgi:hypothetical protein